MGSANGDRGDVTKNIISNLRDRGLRSSKSEEVSNTAVMNVEIKRLRDRLVVIEYAEALSWKDEDLDEITHSKSPWFDIIRWLLEQLSGDSISNDPSTIQNGIQQTVLGLGICGRTQAANLFLGKITLQEHIKFISRLIALVECKRSNEENIENIKDECTGRSDQVLSRIQEVLRSSGDINEGYSQADTKKKNTIELREEIMTVESYAEEQMILKERVEKAKEKIERLRRELGLNDEETAQDYMVRLNKEREELNEKTAELVKSLKPLSKEVTHIFENELSSLMPIDVADPIDLPEIDSLSEKVECILRVQNIERTIENCSTTLMNKSLNESHKENWSTEKTSSLPMFQLYEDVQNALNG